MSLVHIMMDLETMGTVPGCAVLSIGCVVMDFERFRLGDEFYSVISLPDSLENFLEEDPKTRQWWEDKDPAARNVLEEAHHPDALGVEAAAHALNSWFRSLGAGPRTTRLYGNGADFDNPILRVMYHAVNVPLLNSEQGFFGGRCYRTLKTLDELFGPAFAPPKLERAGTHHNALDDARSQALHLMEIVRTIRRIGNNALDDGK